MIHSLSISGWGKGSWVRLLALILSCLCVTVRVDGRTHSRLEYLNQRKRGEGAAKEQKVRAVFFALLLWDDDGLAGFAVIR